MRLRAHATVIRRIVIACALAAVVAPSSVYARLGLTSAPSLVGSPRATSLTDEAPDRTAITRLPRLRPIAAPASWPEPMVTPPAQTTTAEPASPEPATDDQTTPDPPPSLAPQAPVDPPVAAPPLPARPAPPPAVIARVREGGVVVFSHPDDIRSALRYPAITESGSPRVLLTTLTTTTGTDAWIEVYLPTRPNGSTGWIRAGSVDLTTVDDRITVDLATTTVTWERAGAVVGTVDVAIGSPGTPTPTGSFYVTDVLSHDRVGAPTPDGPYGAWIIALSGHSEAMTTFEGGDPRIAIHGTNQPASIGSAASSGCIRMAAGPLETLARNVGLGTPVVIR